MDFYYLRNTSDITVDTPRGVYDGTLSTGAKYEKCI